MVFIGCTSCFAFLVSVAALVWTATSFPTDPNGDLYSGVALDGEFNNNGRFDEFQQSLDQYGYAKPQFRRNELPVESYSMPTSAMKRNNADVQRGGHTLNYLIRRILKLQGKRVPDSRTYPMRFGHGRK